MADLKDMNFDAIVSEQAGRCLMMLGEGTTMRSIVFKTMDLALQWKREHGPFEELEALKAARAEIAKLTADIVELHMIVVRRSGKLNDLMS